MFATAIPLHFKLLQHSNNLSRKKFYSIGPIIAPVIGHILAT
jgi:hypothetical protein